MGGTRKILLTINDDDYRKLEGKAKAEGFGRVSTLVRHLALLGMAADADVSEDKKTIRVQVNNFRELAGYVTEKKFGRVEYFAAYAMENYMNKNQLTAAQKERVDKLLE